MIKKTKTIRVDPELWDKGKMKCIKIHNDMSNYIDDLMRKDLGLKK